jgi:hypothetical protein
VTATPPVQGQLSSAAHRGERKARLSCRYYGAKAAAVAMRVAVAVAAAVVAAVVATQLAAAAVVVRVRAVRAVWPFWLCCEAEAAAGAAHHCPAVRVVGAADRQSSHTPSHLISIKVLQFIVLSDFWFLFVLNLSSGLVSLIRRPSSSTRYCSTADIDVIRLLGMLLNMILNCPGNMQARNTPMS